MPQPQGASKQASRVAPQASRTLSPSAGSHRHQGLPEAPQTAAVWSTPPLPPLHKCRKAHICLLCSLNQSLSPRKQASPEWVPCKDDPASLTWMRAMPVTSWQRYWHTTECWLLFLKNIYLFLFYMCEVSAYVYVYATHACSNHGGQKKMSDSLKLELLMVPGN